MGPTKDSLQQANEGSNSLYKAEALQGDKPCDDEDEGETNHGGEGGKSTFYPSLLFRLFWPKETVAVLSQK